MTRAARTVLATNKQAGLQADLSLLPLNLLVENNLMILLVIIA